MCSVCKLSYLAADPVWHDMVDVVHGGAVATHRQSAKMEDAHATSVADRNARLARSEEQETHVGRHVVEVAHKARSPGYGSALLLRPPTLIPPKRLSDSRLPGSGR